MCICGWVRGSVDFWVGGSYGVKGAFVAPFSPGSFLARPVEAAASALRTPPSHGGQDCHSLGAPRLAPLPREKGQVG
eukprot:9933277-Alexandrium_andersonii.AAC.1